MKKEGVIVNLSETKVKNHIGAFIHCANCLKKLPEGQSPREWGRYEAGWTEKGFQIWCIRCENNVLNIDLLGQKVECITSIKLYNINEEKH